MRELLVALAGAAALLSAAGCGRDHSPHPETQEVEVKRALTVLYFDGCPNTPGFVEATEQAAARLGAGWRVELVDLQSLPEDDLRRGYGSPTVLLDGRDLFGAPDPTSASLNCRHYPRGNPTADSIARAAEAFRRDQ